MRKEEAVAFLNTLPEEELRPILSELANKTPKSVYYPKNFLEGFPEKTTEDGKKMSGLGMGAMMIANFAAEELVQIGDEMQCEFTGLSHGNKDNGNWRVVVKRI